MVREADSTGGWGERLEGESGSEDYEGGPEDVGAQEVDCLEPDGGEEDDVEDAEDVLKGEEDEDRGGEAAIVPRGGAAGSADEDPDEKDAGQKGDGGVSPAPAHEPAAGGREILKQG